MSHLPCCLPVCLLMILTDASDTSSGERLNKVQITSASSLPSSEKTSHAPASTKAATSDTIKHFIPMIKNPPTDSFLPTPARKAPLASELPQVPETLISRAAARSKPFRAGMLPTRLLAKAKLPEGLQDGAVLRPYLKQASESRLLGRTIPVPHIQNRRGEDFAVQKSQLIALFSLCSGERGISCSAFRRVSRHL